MENPIRKTREAIGIDRSQLALLSSVSYSTVAANETGRQAEPSPDILKTLAKFGYDSDIMREEYVKWRNELRERIALAV